MNTPFHLLLNGIYLFFLGIIIIGGFLITDTFRESKKEAIGGFCGVIDPYENDSELVRLGDQLFGIECATCHAKDMHTDATGLALADMMRKWNQDTLALFSYIQNAALYFEQHPESRIANIHEKEKIIKPIYQDQLTHDDLKAIIAYVEARH
jgi:mono/diheme cytochrome c family protein